MRIAVSRRAATIRKLFEFTGDFMFECTSRSARLSFIILAVFIGSTATAWAEGPKECGPWTLFPDFRCETWNARPDDAFNPVGMPYLFEDPHNTTGLNFAYIYHRLPENMGPPGFPVFDGGGMHVLALQIRLAITPRISFIATKDGLAILRPGSDSVIDPDTDIFDMTVGFKGSLIDSREHNFILSPAVRYEIPMGSKHVFQNFGDGVFIPSASFRWGLGEFGLDGANIVGSLGGQIPIDSDKNVQSLFWNLHLDYGFKINNSIVKYIVPFLEVNGLHYTRSSDGTNPVYLRGGGKLPLGVAQTALGTGRFEGLDVANLGSQGMTGKDVVVMGGGFRIPTTWGVSFAAMYEGPVTNRKDIHNQRFTFMMTWEL
jgi:hypothetical protein